MFEDNEGNKATEQLPDGALRDKDGLLLISKSKHQGLAQWTPTHQFIWTKKFQLPLPNNFSACRPVNNQAAYKRLINLQSSQRFHQSSLSHRDWLAIKLERRSLIDQLD
ncbi:hypothetical protein Ptr902_12135 [Pyrenophora tritici-repentis]|nr:hypothetical protein Ptr902_12135 [Pyrenophora tritici-repentis]